MENIKKVEGIPLDAIIDVQVSGQFYFRLHQLLSHYTSQKTPEEFMKDLAQLKAGEPKDPYQYHLQTILTMMFDIETKAKEQNKIKTTDHSLGG